MKALLLLVAGLGGLIEAVAPRRVVALWTRALYRNAGEAEPREWVYAAAKVEGTLIAAGALVGLFRLATADGDFPVDDSTAADEPESDPAIAGRHGDDQAAAE
ncbi:hypothetical protein PN419_13455 [Halorubrum ezzemoulense]|uniref:Uncharacterized protein n=1 Tax=Halorubrum ezzemoulense TaxID=337243 RepID=A0A256JVK1_HALEZ|nr:MULTISPECIES: hypothetical protein [Halorubrum]MDB2237527.1 hypothetical protein [Halorubrum ezzemoulense]MDB2248979.1 hypothetical protein [Halorubrum ezzemoulense]MDB9249992.1 hypothetical protein [Halorubrum ezzemoulense]MDB9260017.1 hypothetical protein [Halorubrum ezzemoulense]MDB9263436.1 hypothetical protein [Halorubrum ezzemoulense]